MNKISLSNKEKLALKLLLGRFDNLSDKEIKQVCFDKKLSKHMRFINSERIIFIKKDVAKFLLKLRVVANISVLFSFSFSLYHVNSHETFVMIILFIVYLLSLRIVHVCQKTLFNIGLNDSF